MIVFRLSKSRFCRDLSGKGAEKCGGRWNEKGFPMIYTSNSRALCLAEIAVHIPLGIIPTDFVLTTIEFPDSVEVNEIQEGTLLPAWKVFPHTPYPQNLGTSFLKKGTHLVLKVPSAVVQGEFNYLINPNHKAISKVKILKEEPFYFDERLFK